ncbi:MAG: SDR family NAD(P)-dependent oxidoreductase [Candidatus Rokubacteria bacterium]|nr:SDR family NAD(P)-dependent oxidoreductase [Candidatus Rokubacteria bacterium]
MNEVAIVTGGTGALGQAVTLRLLRDGASVVVPWVVADEEKTLASRVPADWRPRLLTVECDVTDASSMASLVKTSIGKFRYVRVLVTAVGGFAGGGLLQTDLDGWNRMLSLNLTSAFIAARAVGPWMLHARYGRIVMVASRAVVPPVGGLLAYTVSKAGVITLTQALAAELEAAGITVNAVLPSTMDTPANRAAMPDADPTQWTPVDAVADAVAFLAREDSGHITGTLLSI